MANAQPQASVLLCNSIAQEIGSNNLVVIGSFDGLQSSMFPTKATFYAVAKVWGMGPSPENVVSLKLVDQNGKVVAQAGEHKYATESASQVHTAISLFQNVEVPASGTYMVQAFAGPSPLVLTRSLWAAPSRKREFGLRPGRRPRSLCVIVDKIRQLQGEVRYVRQQQLRSPGLSL